MVPSQYYTFVPQLSMRYNVSYLEDKESWTWDATTITSKPQLLALSSKTFDTPEEAKEMCEKWHGNVIKAPIQGWTAIT